MSTSSDYLERLRNIRQKYGCPQPKPQGSYNDQYLGIQRPSAYDKTYLYEKQKPTTYERPTGASYYRADQYSVEKPKIAQQMPYPSTIGLGSRPYEYSGRPQSSIALGSQGLGATNDYTKKVQRQREIEQIRQNYAASRKKVIEDYSTKSYNRDFLKQNTKDYSKVVESDYLKQYSRRHRDQVRDYEVPIPATKIDLLRKQQPISPIKIMGDLEEKKSYRQRELDNSDTFWKQREARLSELTANRLNQNTKSSYLRDDKLSQQKIGSAKQSGIYGGDKLKSYHQPQHHKLDSENKLGQYTVSNIDRIQQRIQSILNKK